MNDQTVYVRFDTPRPVREVGVSYFLGNGEGKIQLPRKLTSLERNAENLVTAVMIPQWLAEDRGLVGIATHDDKMTRQDWFFLGAMMAKLIRGETISTAVLEARNVVAKMLEES